MKRINKDWTLKNDLKEITFSEKNIPKKIILNNMKKSKKSSNNFYTKSIREGVNT